MTFLTKTSSLALAVVALALAGCMRGGVSELPPVHLVLDMDFQPKLKAQGKNDFAGWSDHRNMRAPVADGNGKTAVVARGSLPNPALANRDANNAFVTKNPLALTSAVLARGQDRFNIHCSVCHGYSGRGGNDPVTGNGMVGRRWPIVIPTFHYQEGKDAAANRVAMLPDGEIFEMITNGKGLPPLQTMPQYGTRLSVEDRWSIVHYVRALQQLSK